MAKIPIILCLLSTNTLSALLASLLGILRLDRQARDKPANTSLIVAVLGVLASRDSLS